MISLTNLVTTNFVLQSLFGVSCFGVKFALCVRLNAAMVDRQLVRFVKESRQRKVHLGVITDHNKFGTAQGKPNYQIVNSASESMPQWARCSTLQDCGPSVCVTRKALQCKFPVVSQTCDSNDLSACIVAHVGIDSSP